jgi:polyisoprenoid-binding protein YceI
MRLVRLSAPLLVAIVLPLASSSATGAQTDTPSMYSVNQAASSIAFTIYGSMIFKIKRDGLFKDFSGQLSYDPENPTGAHVDLTVYTDSIDMHDDGNNRLMKSPDFFDVARFPTMHFSNTAVDVKPDGSLEMTGAMTIRGITRQMTIPVQMRPAARDGDASGAVFESTFPIDRTAFGLNGSPRLGGFKVSIAKNVDIHIEIATSLVRSSFVH